jgi:hypothetical protein
MYMQCLHQHLSSVLNVPSLQFSKAYWWLQYTAIMLGIICDVLLYTLFLEFTVLLVTGGGFLYWQIFFYIKGSGWAWYYEHLWNDDDKHFITMEYCREDLVRIVIWIRSGISSGLSWIWQWTFGFIKGRKFLVQLSCLSLLQSKSMLQTEIKRSRKLNWKVYQYISFWQSSEWDFSTFCKPACFCSLRAEVISFSKWIIKKMYWQTVKVKLRIRFQ